MRKRKSLLGVLLTVAVTAFIIMTLPVSEADAATSASDFLIEGGKLIKYRGTDKNVSIPSTVEIIGESAFEENTHIEVVTIPNTVKRIDAYVFWGCNNLNTVVLGGGLTDVGDYAFAGCKGLKQMAIPANIVTIGIQAFGDCVNMTDISIPAETFRIHETAFDGCVKLRIHCQEGTAADTFAQAFYEKQKEMTGYEEGENPPAEEVIPEQTPVPAPTPVADPEEEYWDMLGSTSVVGNRAMVFLDAGGLQVIEPTSIPDLEEQIISGLTELAASLGNVVFMVGREVIPKYTVVDGKVIADQAFYGSDSLGEVSLDGGIREIGQFAFARSSATRVVLPKGVTDIDYGAFYHCENLSSVELPETVMNLEPRAFANTAWVKSFYDRGEDFLISGGVLVAYAGDDAFVAVPGGVRVIGAEAFAGHTEMESVRLPDSVLVVGEAAFEGCTGLKRVNLGDGVEQIKDRAFDGCGELEVLKLPKSVKSVGLQAFDRADLIYEGVVQERTYETSATRLSNEDFRKPGRETETPGVTVIGEGLAEARLEGAKRRYTLSIIPQQDVGDMETAWRRVMEGAVPENMAVYDLRFADKSGIPLQELGYSGLVVTIPIPEELIGRELKMVIMDRNGQLESLGVERVTLEGREALRFRTTKVSKIGIYGK